MKKKMIKIIILIFSLLGLGCIGVNTALDYEDEIIHRTFCETYRDGRFIRRFEVKLGRYNGAVAVYYEFGGATDMHRYNIGHIHFAFPFSDDDIFIYKDGKICDLLTAYNQKIININQVAKIQLKYNNYKYLFHYGKWKLYI